MTRKMHNQIWSFGLAFLCLGSALVFADDLSEILDEETYAGEARTSNASTVAIGLVLLAAVSIAFVLGLVLLSGPIFSAQKRYSPQEYDAYNQGYAGQYRSDDEGHAMDTASILKWIQMLTEMYNDFDYKDIDCQKKYVCEILKDTKLFHTDSLKKGMQYAKYLEVISMPDELRDVLDEYIDAYEVSNGRKECEEYFTCPFSISDSYKRNIVGNEIN